LFFEVILIITDLYYPMKQTPKGR